MNTTSVHNIKVTIGNTTQHATSEALAKTFIKEIAKVSKEATEKKLAFKQMEAQLTTTKKGVATATPKTNITPTTTSAKGGANVTTAGKASSAAPASGTTPSASGGSTTNIATSTEGGATVNPPTTRSTTPSVPEVSATPKNTTPNSSKTSTVQATAEAPVVQEKNTSNPLRNKLLSKFREEVQGPFDTGTDLELINNYKKIIIELENEAIPIEEIVLKHAVAMDFYKQIASKDDETIDWAGLRKKMAANIESNLTDFKDGKRNRYWEYLKQELENPATDIFALFENHNDLFYLLDTVLETPEFIAISERLMCKLAVTLPGSSSVYNYKLSTKAIYGILKKRKESIDPNGASVSKIKTKIDTYSYLPNTPIEFEAHKTNKTNKEKINWIVYNDKGEKIKEYIDVGVSFTHSFPEKGNYIVEAYGSGKRKRSLDAAQKSSKAKPKGKGRMSYIAIAITHPQIASITLPFTEKDIRFNATKKYAFKIVANIKDTEKQIKDITWQVFYSKTKKGKFNGECQDLSAYANTPEALVSFEKEGYYQVVARAAGSKDVKTEEFLVTGNYVTNIQASTTTLLYNKPNQNLIINATEFKFKATNDDRKAVSWKAAYNKEKAIKKDYKGIKFTPVALEKAKEGIYTISAYTPDSIYGNPVPAKVTIVHPTVTEAYFTNTGGSIKESTGYNENAYIYAQLDNYVKDTVDIEVLSGKEVIQTFKNIKTNEFSEVKDLKFTLAAKDKSRITKPLSFTLKGTDGYLLKKQDRTFPKNGLQVLDTQEITNTYFTFRKNKIDTKKYALPIDTKVQAIIETTNYSGEKLTTSIFKATEANSSNGIEIFTIKSIVKNDGSIIIDFPIEKYAIDDCRYFYIDVKTPDGYWCSGKENLATSMLLIYKENDVLPQGMKVYTTSIDPWPVKDTFNGLKRRIDSGVEKRNVKGIPTASKNHQGLDINFGSGYDDYGAPINVTHDGYVHTCKDNTKGTGGRFLEIMSPNKVFMTRYLHLSEITVKKGQKVRKGQVIGKLGGSYLGYEKHPKMSSHLHYEIRKVKSNGRPGEVIDPNEGKGYKSKKIHLIDPQKMIENN